MKLDRIVLGNALALAAVILWVGCSLLVWLLPGLSLLVTRWWMHGLDISVMGGWSLNLKNFVLGGVSLAGSVWVSGYVFGWAWEKASGK